MLPDFNKLWVYSDPQGTEAKFRELLPLAEASDDRGYHAELLTQLARTQSLQRKFDQAHEILDSVDTMVVDGMDVPRIRYHLERGRTYNSSNYKDEALEQFHQAYDLALRTGHDGYAVDAAHMIAIAESDNDKVLDWNLKALALAEVSTSPEAKKWLGSLYNNIGWTYHTANRFDEALDMFNKQLVWQEERGNVGMIFISKWCVARCYRSLGRTGEALEVQRALYAEREASSEGHDGYVLEEIGECLLEQGQDAESAPYFGRAYELLSTDIWLQAEQKERLERMKQLSQTK